MMTERLYGSDQCRFSQLVLCFSPYEAVDLELRLVHGKYVLAANALHI